MKIVQFDIGTYGLRRWSWQKLAYEFMSNPGDSQRPVEWFSTPYLVRERCQFFCDKSFARIDIVYFNYRVQQTLKYSVVSKYRPRV